MIRNVCLTSVLVGVDAVHEPLSWVAISGLLGHLPWDPYITIIGLLLLMEGNGKYFGQDRRRNKPKFGIRDKISDF